MVGCSQSPEDEYRALVKEFLEQIQAGEDPMDDPELSERLVELREELDREKGDKIWHEIYQLDTGQLPQKLEDFTTDSDVGGWRGPYAKIILGATRTGRNVISSNPMAEDSTDVRYFRQKPSENQTKLISIADRATLMV